MSHHLPKLALLAAACTAPQNEMDPMDLPPVFVNDCETVENNSVETATPLQLDARHEDVALCKRETDVYRLEIPEGAHVTVEISNFGSGRDRQDLDLFQLDASGETIWSSASEQPYERLAWYNPEGAGPMEVWLMVDGYERSAAEYDLDVQSRPFHEGKNCDKFYADEDSTESGPCNEILQFPQSSLDDEGYFVEHQPHYANLRREVQYLVRWATRETAAAFGETGPLALMDMSERDGGTPGAMVNQLRHPEGTHENGNDLDIAYYQLNGDNGGRVVCENDGYFCTAAPHLLDAPRSAFFIAMLMRSPNIRVVGVDTLIAGPLQDAARELAEEGKLKQTDVSNMFNYLAYGEGWPFHHHHLHFSWSWETGFEPSVQAEGCLTQPGPYPSVSAMGQPIQPHQAVLP